MNSSNSSLFNTTLTCAAENIGDQVEWPHPPPLTVTTLCVLILYYMYISFFGAVLNSFVIYLVCKFKTLRNIEFIFAVQIAVVGLVRSVLVTPFQLASVIANRWLFGAVFCSIIGDLSYFLSTLRLVLMLAFVTDRFLNVFAPYAYPKIRTKVLIAKHCVVYTTGALGAVLYAVFDCGSFSSSSWKCEFDIECGSWCIIFGRTYQTAVFLPCNILPVVLYVALFCRAKKSIPRFQIPLPAPEALQRAKEERERNIRLTVTFSLMFFALFLISNPPNLILFLISDLGLASRDSAVFYIFHSLALNAFILSSIADPVFILRNRDVREVLPKVTWLPPFWYCSYRQNRKLVT